MRRLLQNIKRSVQQAFRALLESWANHRLRRCLASSTDPVECFARRFPIITELVGLVELKEKASYLLEKMRDDPTTLTDVQRKHSRGFWNCVVRVIGRHAHHDAATWWLSEVEAGLATAKKVGKERQYRKRLLREDAFLQVVAELLVLTRLHDIGTEFDIERTGRKPPKNYDLHVGLPDGRELHFDSKWRTASPTGEVDDEFLSKFRKLLMDDLDRGVFITLRRNRLSDEEIQDVALFVLELQQRRDEITATGRLVTNWSSPSISTLPADSFGEVYMSLDPSVGVRVETIDGTAVVLFVDEDRFIAGHPLVASVEFFVEDRSVGVMGPSETRPVVPKSVATQMGATSSKTDHASSEGEGIQGLLRSVYQQLPTDGYNIPCLGLSDPTDMQDAEWAIAGYPSESSQTFGGLNDSAEFKTITGVLVFWVVPPIGGAKARLGARYVPNPNIADQPPVWLIRLLEKALKK